MTMRLKLYTLLCISFLLIFTACNQDDDPVPAEKVTRTVLAYIMADNSLSGFASIDIDEMMKGMEAVDASLYNLLVYVDDASREGSQSYKFPTLYRLSKDKNGNVVKETVNYFMLFMPKPAKITPTIVRTLCTPYVSISETAKYIPTNIIRNPIKVNFNAFFILFSPRLFRSFSYYITYFTYTFF